MVSVETKLDLAYRKICELEQECERLGNLDLQAFFAEFASFNRGGYTKDDKHQDFLATFTSDEGKRVLAQIIDKTEGSPIIEADVESTHRMAFRAGARSVGLWIVMCMTQQTARITVQKEETNV